LEANPQNEDLESPKHLIDFLKHIKSNRFNLVYKFDSAILKDPRGKTPDGFSTSILQDELSFQQERLGNKIKGIYEIKINDGRRKGIVLLDVLSLSTGNRENLFAMYLLEENGVYFDLKKDIQLKNKFKNKTPEGWEGWQNFLLRLEPIRNNKLSPEIHSVLEELIREGDYSINPKTILIEHGRNKWICGHYIEASLYEQHKSSKDKLQYMIEGFEKLVNVQKRLEYFIKEKVINEDIQSYLKIKELKKEVGEYNITG